MPPQLLLPACLPCFARASITVCKMCAQQTYMRMHVQAALEAQCRTAEAAQKEAEKQKAEGESFWPASRLLL